MIEAFLVSELGTIPALRGQIYPIAAPVGDLEPPFCIYTRTSGQVVRDLSGEPAFYTDTFRLDLHSPDTDELAALAQAASDSLAKVNEDCGDLYVFSAYADPGIMDGYDASWEMYIRSLNYTVTYWR